MATAVYGLFDDKDEAQHAIDDLVDAGYDKNQISVIAGDHEGHLTRTGGAVEGAAGGAASGAATGAAIGGAGGLILGLAALAIPGVGPFVAAGPIAAALTGAATGAGIGAVAGGLVGGLTKAGVPEEDAHFYAEGVRRGGYLVSVTTDDARASEVSDIMVENGAVDMDRRGQYYRTGGFQRYETTAKPYTREEIVRDREMIRQTAPDQMKLKVVQENLEVGKQQVASGGVRVRTYVTQQPVQEQVQVREEHVEVDRRPVDRPATAADLDTFKEGVVEIHETKEVPIAQKEARVIEEVNVGKTAEQRTETVGDTVRRTHVEVEPLAGAGAEMATDLETEFRNDFTTRYGSTGSTYETYAPAYRYGHQLATSGQTGDWTTLEPEVRRRWEEQNQGTWDRYKDAVRWGWERSRARTSGAKLI